MKEKIRVGFDADFQIKEIEVAAGDPAPWDPSRKFAILGTRVPRLDGKPKATGEAKYSIDVRLPGMLYGRILRCPLAAATVTSVDLSAARTMPGVRAALAHNSRSSTAVSSGHPVPACPPMMGERKSRMACFTASRTGAISRPAITSIPTETEIPWYTGPVTCTSVVTSRRGSTHAHTASRKN